MLHLSHIRSRLVACISVGLASLVLLSALTSCGLSDTYKQYAADRKTVAVCNGYDIPYEELRFVTMYYKGYLADIHGGRIWEDAATAETYREELEELVNRNLSQNYLVLSACRALGIDTDSKEIDEYVDEQMQALEEDLGSDKAYKEFLSENAMSEHYLRFTLSIGFLESAIHYTLLDQKLYEYSMSNIADYMDYVEDSGDYVRTIHVYIENTEDEDPAANLARAQEISDALQAEDDFEKRRRMMGEFIGSKDNDDLTSVSGHGYYFTRGEMDERYEEASFGIEIGEVSEPVVCSGGNFVIMRLELEEDYIAQNVSTLLNNYHAVRLGVYIEQFRPACDVAYTDYGKTIDLVTMQ